MKDYSHIMAAVAEADPRFEEFYRYCLDNVPGMKVDGRITLPAPGLKLALKTAYTAGRLDQAQDLADALADAPEDHLSP